MLVQGRRSTSFPPALLGVVGLLCVTEYSFAYVSESLGILLSLASVFSIYSLLSLFNLSSSLTEALEEVAVLFIYALLVAALPWFFFRPELLTPAVYSIVLALVAWRMYARGFTLRDAGFLHGGLRRDCLLGVALGVPTGVIEYLVLRPRVASPFFDAGFFVQTAVQMLFFVALGEELLFRSLIQKSLIDLTGTFMGIIWTAAIFGIMHTVWRSVPELIFTFGAGLLLGLLYKRTNSIIGPILLHGVNNIILLAVMPYIL